MDGDLSGGSCRHVRIETCTITAAIQIDTVRTLYYFFFIQL